MVRWLINNYRKLYYTELKRLNIASQNTSVSEALKGNL